MEEKLGGWTVRARNRHANKHIMPINNASVYDSHDSHVERYPM